MHLYFQSSREDKEAFESFISRKKSYLENVLLDPANYFFDQTRRIIFNNNTRYSSIIPTEEEIDKIDFKRAYHIFDERFDDAADVHVLFCRFVCC